MGRCLFISLFLFVFVFVFVFVLELVFVFVLLKTDYSIFRYVCWSTPQPTLLTERRMPDWFTRMEELFSLDLLTSISLTCPFWQSTVASQSSMLTTGNIQPQSVNHSDPPGWPQNRSALSKQLTSPQY